MLSLNEINEIRSLILSDRCTFKGNEFVAVTQVVAALAREEQLLKQAARVTPKSELQPVAAPPADTAKPPQE